MRRAIVSLLVVLTPIMMAILLRPAHKSDSDGARKAYIIRMASSAKPSHFASHHHWYASTLKQVSSSGELLYTYDTVFHGFAATLSSAEAEAMERTDGCLAVIPSSLHQLDTTRSPDFLGLPVPSGVWSKYSIYVEDIIVGVIDIRVSGLRAKASVMRASEPFHPDGKAHVKLGRISLPRTATRKSSELDTSSKAT